MIAIYKHKELTLEKVKNTYPKVWAGAMDIYEEGDSFYIKSPSLSERVILGGLGGGFKADCHIVMKRDNEEILSIPLGKNMIIR
jgi:hypothetical protein